jgi:aminomuconate-semialdehyde/2-hydroxymuconate-6-semialdehyde dehydrogenase
VNSSTGNSTTGNSSTGNSTTGNSSTGNFIPHLIDGEETESVSGARFASVDPWTREPYAEVALGGQEDADRAVQAARRAFDEGPWPRMGYAERGALLHRFADLIIANGDALGLADTTDMGKPISESCGNARN